MCTHFANCKEIYLAKNIEALNVLAKITKDKGKEYVIPHSFENKCDNLEKLYKAAQNNLYDQEKTYIYLYRFLFFYEKYAEQIKDKNFMNARFSTQLEKGRKQFEQLKKDLNQRYSSKNAREKENQKPSSDCVAPVKLQRKYPDEAISCSELYSALNDPKNKILLVDARSKDDYIKSKINIGNVINVPDEVIRSGLSANSIAVPPEFKTKWDERETYDIIILFDWNSTLETMKATKLEKLLSSLVDWDPNKIYLQKPIILNGGYFEWAEQYPSCCTNPNFVMNHLYNELDEILKIDDIDYPSDENKAPNLIFQEPETTPRSHDDQDESFDNDKSREELIQKNKELSMQSTMLLNEIIEKERKWKDSQGDKDKSKDLEETISTLKKQLDDVTDERDEIQKKFKLFASFDPMKENLEMNQIKEIADIDKSETEKFKICLTMEQQRLDALAEARALKPKTAGGDNNIASNEAGFSLNGSKPYVNRTNKPYSVTAKPVLFNDPITFNPEGGGLVGLKNIRNTCYMNTVVQCMRNVPTLADLFCTGLYRREICRKPDAIIMETASLFRSLWSNIHQCINPVDFYEKVCSIEPNYRMGNHEDCMEFFLFLLNNLSEDCATDLQKQSTMTPSQQASFNQLGGKSSIFIKLFYHQIRIKQSCQNCNKTTYKFEMESTFMLPVPDGDFRIEDLMRNYLQDDIIDDYCCSKCKKPVTNSKNVLQAPKILVIVLKRYKQTLRNNNVSVTKIESRVSFPTTGFAFGGKRYHLNSIALHSGSMTSGHYTAASCINYRWYELNDEIVRPIDIDDDIVRSKACAFFYSSDLIARNVCDNSK